MGSYRPGAPPSGGDTIFSIIRVHEWMAHTYQVVFTGLLRIIFRDAADSDIGFGAARYWNQRVHAMIESGHFWQNRPGCLEMGYGEWVERQLRICVYNRMAMVQIYPVWKTLDLAAQVKLTAKVVFNACLRVGQERGYAYHGLTPPPEPPLTVKGPDGKEHVIGVQAVKAVLSYGPGPL